jgi:hypothetical protein
MRVQLTVRVEPHTADYIATLAGKATRATGIRVTANTVAAALLERAEAEGWTIDAHRPAAAPPAPGPVSSFPSTPADGSGPTS